MKTITAAKTGFSLLEVMLGMVIFMIGMLGVIAMQIAMVRGNDFSAKVTEASTLGANQLESLMVLSYGDPALDDGGPNTTNNLAANGVAGLDDGPGQADYELAAAGTNNQFTVIYNVAPNVPAANCKTIRVIIRWSEKGNARQISMTGIRTT